jgi:hypothetical protein
MSEERHRSRWRGTGGPGGCGCAGVIVVLTLGLILSLLNTDIGIGISVRVPFTESNVTVAGSVGKREHASDVLPAYVRGRLGGNQNFINQSNTLTIWVAEGTALFVIGHQPGAPVIDLHIEGK